MRPIQFLISMLLLAYASVNLMAQTANDTVRITYKGKGVTIRPQGDESKTTVRFKDTATGKNIVVKVTVKDINDNESNTDSDEDSDSSFKKTFRMLTKSMDKKERKHFIENSFFPNFDLGFVSTINESENANAMNPRYNKSANIQVGLIKQDMNLYKQRILLSYGLSVNSYYLKYKDKQKVQSLDNNGHLTTYTDTINNFDKNRLDVKYLTVPLLLEYYGKGGKFSIAGGVEYSFGGNSNVVTKGDKQSLEFIRKEENNIKINPTQLNAVLRVGYDHLAIYGRYTLTDMYQGSAYANNTNPHQHLFSVGICLFGI